MSRNSRFLATWFLAGVMVSAGALPEPQPSVPGFLQIPSASANWYTKSPVRFPKVSPPVKILLIGDSLSFGSFGEALEGFLRQRYKASEICVFASCGSSPEHWLETGPTFLTPCGYRESTPDGAWKEDFANGHRPRPVRTPKIPEILARISPRTVVVQLGTNWMDRLPAAPNQDGAACKQIIRQFIKELRAQQPPPARIVWILPPDSSKYPAAVKDEVDRWISECAKELGFQTINSRRITGRYLQGKTGNDGVHYNDAEGAKWAKSVNWLLYISGPE
ncbi:MAG: SGNH/GDSL hydrolase family protein [Verrucomicrobiae bacterium]